MMKKYLRYMIPVKTYICYIFTISMFIFLIIGGCAGTKTMAMGFILQLLILSMIAGFLQSLVFSDLLFKKMRYGTRIIIFLIPYLGIFSAFSIIFKWFPVANILSWIIFLAIFIFCAAVITGGFELYFRITGQKYDDLLKAYKKKERSNGNKE